MSFHFDLIDKSDDAIGVLFDEFKYGCPCCKTYCALTKDVQAAYDRLEDRRAKSKRLEQLQKDLAELGVITRK